MPGAWAAGVAQTENPPAGGCRAGGKCSVPRRDNAATEGPGRALFRTGSASLAKARGAGNSVFRQSGLRVPGCA